MNEPETPDQLSPKSQGSHRSIISYGQGNKASKRGGRLKDKASLVRRESIAMSKITQSRKVDNPTNIQDILMNICHSLTINEKTVFVAQLRKLMLAID